MRKSILVAFTAALVFPAASALATGDCNIVNRELRLGKWPEDVALGMGLTLAEVKQCREQPTAQPGQAGKRAPATNTSPQREPVPKRSVH